MASQHTERENNTDTSKTLTLVASQPHSIPGLARWLGMHHSQACQPGSEREGLGQAVGGTE